MARFFMHRYEDAALALFRVAAGLLFWQHGAQKLLGWLGGAGAPGQTVPLASMPGVAGLLEFVGGILIMVGLFTRPVAFLLSGLMAAAYFIAHFPRGFWPAVNEGELAALYCFVFLYLAARGGGRHSVDGMREGRDGARREG